MHGLVFAELRAFIETVGGTTLWGSALRGAGLGWRIYAPFGSYPESEARRLLGTTGEVTGVAMPTLLEQFGSFVAPHLLDLYRHRISPAWSLMDLLENADTAAGELLRLREPGTTAHMRAARVSPSSLVLELASPWPSCSMVKGVVRGLARNFGERVELVEPACSQHGGSSCRILVAAHDARFAARDAPRDGMARRIVAT